MDLLKIQPSLIRDCINRSRRAEHELYKITYSYLMSICIRYTKNTETASEVLNIGFYKILTNLNKYRQEVPFKSWIRRVMINTLINEYKKEKIHYENIQYVPTYFDDDKYSEINLAIEHINADYIFSFIAKLPPATKQVFNLYFIDDYKHSEIAELLNISEGTSKWHLNAAREKLKIMLCQFSPQLKTTTT